MCVSIGLKGLVLFIDNNVVSSINSRSIIVSRVNGVMSVIIMSVAAAVPG